MKYFIIIFLTFIFKTILASEPTFIIGGQAFPVSGFQIVISTQPGEVELKAAVEFQKYLGLVRG